MATPQPPAPGGIHHLKLPVSDLDRSARWYTEVLGARRLTELDHRRPDGTLYAVILDVPGLGTLLELRLDPATAAALGRYDFLTLAVDDRAALDRWITHLDDLDILHSPPLVALVGWLLVIPDPDGLRLRLYTTQPHGLDASEVDVASPWLGTGPVATSAVCVVATIGAVPGREDELDAHLRTLAQATRQEAGCLGYRVHRAQNDPATFVVYEQWADQAAQSAHHGTTHMSAFRKNTENLADGPPHAELLVPQS
ncbi:antibiotic biosynthesis monooxygenase [Actinacidiphila soli]|uniref:antibiotic biosynthesis monooxygenase n=1 Tax=Actinacidiphila soli TaxID=2487275 RepID=UPI0013E35AEC|nr:antibiotic biosynthesis monooxygenase [Actinacidiphila soli]